MISGETCGQPLISVVVPLYNKEGRVLQCITSIAAQTVSAFEVIIVDDGSTDDSARIAGDALKRFSLPGLIVSQKNGGVSSARNAGVAMAKADHVGFLDADDEWAPEFIARMTSLIADFPAAGLYGCAHSFSNEHQTRVVRPSVHAGFRGYLSDFFLASLSGSVANSSKAVVQKEAFNEIGGFPVGEASGEDMYVWMRLASRFNVAFDDFVGAYVTVVEDQSRHSRVGAPYPIKYYAKAGLGSLPASGRLLLRRILLTRCLYLYSRRDLEAVRECSSAATPIFPVITRLLGVVSLLPATVASWLISLGRAWQGLLRALLSLRQAG